MAEVAAQTTPAPARPGWLLWRAAPVVVLRASGALLGLLFWVVLSRLLGPSGAGVMRQGLAALMIAAVLLRFGLDNVLMRETAVLTGEGRMAASRSLVRRCLSLTFVVGAVLSCVALALAIFAHRSGGLATEVLWTCVAAALPLSLLTLAGEAEKGAGHAAWGTFLQFNARNLMYLPLAILVIGGGRLARASDLDVGTQEAAWLLVGSISLVSIVATLRWLRGSGDSAAPRLKEQLPSAFPLYQCALFGVALEWLDTLALGAFAPDFEVGVYGAAASAALVMSFLLYASNSIVAPRFARAFRAGETEQLEREARMATRLMGLVALPFAALLALFAEPLLSVFGPEFTAAVPAFRVLLVGHILNMATGPVGYLLLMGHRERAFRNNVAIAALIDLLLLALLVPRFGIVGAAAATAAAMVAVNLLHLVACHRELGFSTLGPSSLSRP